MTKTERRLLLAIAIMLIRLTELSRMACMMVDWFADRAFTCPDSLSGTIETYKGLIVVSAHNAVEG